MLFSCLHRSPSQGRQEFESSWTEFDLFLSNINDLSLACSIITGDFRAILKKSATFGVTRHIQTRM